MVLLRYEKNMSMDRCGILKTSITDPRLNLALANQPIIKGSSQQHLEDDKAYEIPQTQPQPTKKPQTPQSS